MRIPQWFFLFGIIILIVFLFFFFIFPRSDPAGDWGDAPDPDVGMDTGYYAPFPSPTFPGVFIYDNAGVAAQFPTDNDGVQGPFTIDVDDFWIGPLAQQPFFVFPGLGLLPGAAAAGDAPSVEFGVYDPADPDSPSNLETLPPSMQENKADCDKENASHDPSLPAGFFGRICDPEPPYSIAMSGRLIIVVGNPPLAIFISRIWFSPAAALKGEGVYWNVLFDTNQDGQWSSPAANSEWVEQDQFVPYISTISSRMVATQAFEWGSSGNPFGRLLFPVWARSMVTDESVTPMIGANNYDGRGLAGGFTQGEIEDYFVEWRPIGQIFPQGADSGKQSSSGEHSNEKLEKYDASKEGNTALLAKFEGPKEVKAGEEITLKFSGPMLKGMSLLCLLKKSGMILGAADLNIDQKEVLVCNDKKMFVSATWGEEHVLISIKSAPVGAMILLLGSTGEETALGNGNVLINGGHIMTVM